MWRMVIIVCQWDCNGDCCVSVGLQWWLLCVSGTAMMIIVCQWDCHGDYCVSGTAMVIIVCQWYCNGDYCVSVGLQW
jgi:hypothetical protein